MFLRDIRRWPSREFAYLLSRMKLIPEGDSKLVEYYCLLSG
jgi:hypothetical protein